MRRKRLTLMNEQVASDDWATLAFPRLSLMGLRKVFFIGESRADRAEFSCNALKLAVGPMV